MKVNSVILKRRQRNSQVVRHCFQKALCRFFSSAVHTEAVLMGTADSGCEGHKQKTRLFSLAGVNLVMDGRPGRIRKARTGENHSVVHFIYGEVKQHESICCCSAHFHFRNYSKITAIT